MRQNDIRIKNCIVGVQFLFVAFGATVLVPLLIGIDPTIALFTAGLGTLIFHGITKGKIPIFLGSSFAFIAPIIKATEQFGYSGALSGLMAVGIIYSLVSLLIRKRGLEFIVRLFPPVVVGPVIMIIGLSLAETAVEMAANHWIVASITLFVAIIVVIYAKGTLKLTPVLAGIAVGYTVSIIFGIVDFSPIKESSWLQIPEFVLPTFSWHAVIFLVPVA